MSNWSWDSRFRSVQVLLKCSEAFRFLLSLQVVELRWIRNSEVVAQRDVAMYSLSHLFKICEQHCFTRSQRACKLHIAHIRMKFYKPGQSFAGLIQSHPHVTSDWFYRSDFISNLQYPALCAHILLSKWRPSPGCSTFLPYLLPNLYWCNDGAGLHSSSICTSAESTPC